MTGKAIVVCGPTASGKSDLADTIADEISDIYKGHARTLVVDSMQVYREIPIITNQSRRRPADMVGVASVTDDWTVARHREMSRRILSRTKIPFVLDAGTGMYLNALLLNIELAPKVAADIRRRASILSQGTSNSRRASREIELDLAGGLERGSIWAGDLVYDTVILYLKPDRTLLDRRIEARVNHIIQHGLAEAEHIKEEIHSGGRTSPQVLGAIGVREMVDLLSGILTIEEVKHKMASRTRQLARRQIRWFDKLMHTVSGRATTEILTEADSEKVLHTLHDTIIA